MSAPTDPEIVARQVDSQASSCLISLDNDLMTIGLSQVTEGVWTFSK